MHAARSGPTFVGAMPASSRPLDSLLDKHNEFLGFLERRVGDRALAEDLLQEAFAKSADALAQLREEESVVAWFYRVLRNAVIDHHRRVVSSRTALARFAAEITTEEPASELKDAVCRCVLRLAEELTGDHAEILREVELEEVSVKAYAEQHGIAANTAGVRIHRARQALRSAVLASCGACATHGCSSCSCA